MKHIKALLPIFAIMFCLCGYSQVWAYPSIYPTGTTIFDTSQAYNSYVLVTSWVKNTSEKGVHDPGLVELMDMNGNVVHTWNVPKNRNKRYWLLPNGHILGIVQLAVPYKPEKIEIPGEKVIELDWDGNLVWEYETLLGPHHYVKRLENGNTLILCHEKVPAEMLATVKDVDTNIHEYGKVARKGVQLIGDTIIEVTPDKKIVWEWKSSEYLDVNRFSPNDALSDWTHGNTASVIPENKWFDQGDKRFRPGNIIFNPRNLDMIFIIDKETKQVVWRFHSDDGKGTPWHCHEPEMIPKGLPGEGNILYFDNRIAHPGPADREGKSWVVEIDPVKKEIVWKYSSAIGGQWPHDIWHFFSSVMSSQQKLPNGNVFVSSDCSGRIFQVKPVKKHPEGGIVVWEHIVAGTLTCRSRPYPYDWCPQLRALPKPKERAVTPPDCEKWRIRPDDERNLGLTYIEK